jgi:surface antigen
MMATRQSAPIAVVACVAALLAGDAGVPAPAVAASTAPPHVALELMANGGGDRLDVVVRVRTARPKIACRGIARELGRSERLPSLRTGPEGGARWHWFAAAGVPRARLKIHVRCSFPDKKVHRAKTTETVGPGPVAEHGFRALIQPRSLKTEKWIPDKTRDGSGGGADLYPRGQCTWWVATQRPDLPYFRGRSGDAENWIESAQALNFPTGTKPRVGAVAVFRPGQYRAGNYGHVAYVTAVDGEMITVTEANFRHHKAGTSRTLTWRGLRFIYELADEAPPPPEPPPSLPPIATLLVSGGGGIAGEVSNNDSSSATISDDGRYLAFESTASNLDPADRDTTVDVFVRDLLAGTTALVSRAGASGAKGNGASYSPVISGDGQHVAFISEAWNLDPADGDGAADVYVRNMVSGTTTLVSRATTPGPKANGRSASPDISRDGSRVAFQSYASNLDPADGDGAQDVFLRDVAAGTTTLVSRGSGPSGAKGNDQSFDPAISGDGQHVAFASQAANLDAADTDPGVDVFVRAVTGPSPTTTLVSRADGVKGNSASQNPDISGDGGSVTFESYATNLDADDGDATRDVYVRNVPGAITTLVSRATAGAKGNNESLSPGISDDGHRVTFVSSASNLDPDDGDATQDVFVRDLVTSTTRLVSRATGSSGAKANDTSSAPAISHDGRYAAFTSQAANLDPADGDGASDVFVRDLQTETMMLASRASGSAGVKDRSIDPAVSSDGRYVAFVSNASKLDPDDVDTVADVFVRDVQAGTTTLVSRAAGFSGAKGDDASSSPAISGDGRYVAFTSQASNLDPDDRDHSLDVFVRDVQAGTTTLVSRPAGTEAVWGEYPSSSPAISGDGRYVAFVSAGTNLDPADADPTLDVFVRDLQSATTTLVSRAAGASGAKGNGQSSSPAISGDGRSVAFASQASNLDPDDGDGRSDVFVRDVQSATTTLVSRAAGASGAKGNGASSSPDVSGEGRYVAFASQASNLDPADSDATPDVFIRDLGAATSRLVSRATGESGATGNNASDDPAISDSGSVVTFSSSASNLDPDDGDAIVDVFVRDLHVGATALVSRAAGVSGAKGNNASDSPDVSRAGRYVSFASTASNLDPADGDTISDVFLRDVLGDAASLPAPPDSASSHAGDGTAINAKLSGSRSQKLGRTVVVTISCEAACHATASGTVRVPKLGSAPARTYKTNVTTKAIRRGKKAMVRLRLSPIARVAIRRALRAGRSIVVELSVHVEEADGNARTLTRRVKLKQ